MHSSQGRQNKSSLPPEESERKLARQNDRICCQQTEALSVGKNGKEEWRRDGTGSFPSVWEDGRRPSKKKKKERGRRRGHAQKSQKRCALAALRRRRLVSQTRQARNLLGEKQRRRKNSGRKAGGTRGQFNKRGPEGTRRQSLRNKETGCWQKKINKSNPTC